MSRTPPFRARAADPTRPPCWRDPDGWLISVAGGTRRAAEAIRAAVAGCRRCQLTTPAHHAYCTQLPARSLVPRSVIAGQVVTAAHHLVDPDKYIAGTLHHLKPRPMDRLDPAV